jgi:hypothetical protein
MAEQKAKKTKAAVVKRIFNWIGAALFALLLVAAIYVQAQWKVITLFIVFLLACTALPRALRKWFWLSVGVVVLVLVIWVFLPDDNEGWRPYTFDEELAALEAKYAIPDSENAAVIYNQLLDSYDANAFEPEFMDCNLESLTTHEPWSSKDYPELAQWLAGHENTMTQLIKASKLERCHFRVPADMFQQTESIVTLEPMWPWALLLIRAANNDLAENRIEHALEKYRALLQMAEHLHQQPLVLSIMDAMATETLALEGFTHFIMTPNPAEQKLSLIEETLTSIKYDWSSALPQILDCEKLVCKNAFCMSYETNPKGKVRLTRDPTAATRAQFPGTVPPLTYWKKKLFRAYAVPSWFSMPSTPQKIGDIIDSTFERLYAMAEPDYDWHKIPIGVSIGTPFSTTDRFVYRHMIKLAARIQETELYVFHAPYIQRTALRRGTLILIALRRYKNKHGFWPNSLDDIKGLTSPDVLIDPTNGRPFVYRPTDDSFILYSKGQNNIDDNADCPDDLPIWPSSYFRKKKENTNAK